MHDIRRLAEAVNADELVVYALKLVIITNFAITNAKLALQMIISLLFVVSKLI